MKIKLILIFTLSLTIISAAFMVHPAQAGAYDFAIPIFEGDYYLSRDANHVSHLRIHEHLVAQFPDFDQNHGILRAIPRAYNKHGVNLHIQSVTNTAGSPLNYTSSAQNNNLVLKIGDAGTYVHGQQTYNIDYTLDNVTVTNSGYDGMFWDINGDQWSQSFGSVIARVHLAGDLTTTLDPTGTRCFTGGVGSQAQNCLSSTTATGSPETQITFATTRSLEANETLTTELRFAAGTFAAYKMPASELIKLLAAILFLFILPAVLSLWIVVRQWRKSGRDATGSQVVIAQYLPPKNLSVLGASGLLLEKSDPKAISAQIVDLAVRQYFKIYETTKKVLFVESSSYEIELIRDTTNLRPEEIAVVNMLFGISSPLNHRVNLDSFKNKLYTEASTLGDQVIQELTDASYFRTNPVKAKTPFAVGGTILVAAILAIVFFAHLPWYFTGATVIPGLILLIGAIIMPARTQLGVDTRDHLFGLKLYMKMAEADRIKMLQSPHGELTEKVDVNDTTQLIKLYERLLPYAMLFGIEQDWAKEFAGLYQTPPDWYAGTSAFNVGYFASSISSFSAESNSSFTPPSSSSGGGFSGGGGGGGGGGGW